MADKTYRERLSATPTWIEAVRIASEADAEIASLRARATTDECNAVAELRDLIRALDETNWSSWQTTAKFDPTLKSAREWLADYDERKPE